MKIVFAGLLAIGLLFAAFIALWPMEPVKYADTYYGKLKTACQQTDDAQCCLESVQRMEANGLRMATYPPSLDTPTCLDGESVEQLKCVSSYRWCAPNPTPKPTTTGIMEPANCPQWTPYPPGWCADGTIEAGKLDEKGCRGPPQCLKKETELQSYTACGCGCCGGAEPATQCLYKAKGDSLDAIKAQDQTARQSPQCALVGCGLGTKYQYCD